MQYLPFEKLLFHQQAQAQAKWHPLDNPQPPAAFEYGVDVGGNVCDRRELDPAQAEISELRRLATVTPDLALRKQYEVKLAKAMQKKSTLPLKKKPELMSAREINQALEALEQQSSQLNDQMIAAGRGDWRYGLEITQAAEKGDPLSVQIVAVDDAMDALRSEIAARYGSRTSRLPEGQRGYGPRKAAGYLKIEQVS